MTPSECSTELRRLHNEWWQAVIAKDWDSAEGFADSIYRCASKLVSATEKEADNAAR